MGVKEQARSDQRSCNGAHSAPNEEGRRGAHSAPNAGHADSYPMGTTGIG
jgi:hypothetical protein